MNPLNVSSLPQLAPSTYRQPVLSTVLPIGRFEKGATAPVTIGHVGRA